MEPRPSRLQFPHPLLLSSRRPSVDSGLDYDTALMAGLIMMNPPRQTQMRNFNRFMADAGTVELWGNEYPTMQLLTVGEILDGKRFKTPAVQGRHELEPRISGLPAVGV